MNNKKLLIEYLKKTNEILEHYTGVNSYINEVNILELNKWDQTTCRMLLLRISDLTDGTAFPWCLKNWKDCNKCTYVKYSANCGDMNSPYQRIISELKNKTKYNEIVDIPEIKNLIKEIKTKLTI